MHFIINQSKGIFIYHAKIIFTLSTLVMIRMLIPINFPFTYSIYGTKIMNAIGKVVYFKITEKLMVCDLLLLVWLLGAIIQIIRYLISRKKVHTFLKPYILSNEEVKQSDFYFLLNSFGQQKVKIACLPENVSPAIWGMIHPVIIVPRDRFSSEDLRFILQHELQHYRCHDLYLKAILDLLTAIHWWNPFVYKLRENFNTVIEFSNDYMVTRMMNKKEKVKYAESLLNVAKQKMVNRQCDLSLIGDDHLKERIRLLINEENIIPKRQKNSLILNVLFLTMIMTAALIIVPEPNYIEEAQKAYEKEGAFSITPDNAYFIKDPEGYQLYMDGKYNATIQTIPEDLADVPIYEK